MGTNNSKSTGGDNSNVTLSDYQKVAEAALCSYYENFAKNHNWATPLFQNDLNAEMTKLNKKTGGGKNSKMVEYGESLFSKAKEDLIRKIAKDVFPPGKVSSSSSIDKIVKELKNAVPDPRKGQRVTKNSEVQRKLCNNVAEAINKNYGAPLIDMSSNENVICNKAAEVIHTLVTGMHTEFVGVASDVKTIVENMVVLESYLSSVHDQLVNSIRKCGDEHAEVAIKSVHEFYERLMKELKRQTALLVNIVGETVPKYKADIVDLVRESGDLKDAVSSINKELGTREFGQKLGYLLAGIDNVAQAALLVDKALKKVGMSLKEYEDAKGLSGLREKLYKLATDKRRALNSKELHDFMEAEKILFTNSGELNKEEIVAYLRKKKDRKGGAASLAEEVLELSKATGGQEPAPFTVWGTTGKTLSDRLKKHDEFKKRLFNDFEKELNQHFKKIVAVVHEIAPKIGSEIPVTNDLRVFVRAFKLLQFSNRTNLAVALSGYKLDPMSKDYRNRFLAALDVLHQTLLPLMRGPGGTLFKKLDNNIEELTRLVDRFSKTFLEALVDPLDKDFQTKYRERLAKLGGDLSEEVLTMATKGGDQLEQEILQLSKSVGGALDAEALKMAIQGGSLSDEALMMSANGGNLSEEVLKMSSQGGSLSDEVLMMSANGGEEEFEEAELVETSSGGTNITNQLLDIVKSTSVEGGMEEYSSMSAAQVELAYYTKIANLKDSLHRAAKVTDQADEGYQKRVGLAIASLINKEQESCDNLVMPLKKMSLGDFKDADVSKLNPSHPVVKLKTWALANPNNAPAKTAAEGMIYIYDEECKAKRRFLEALENMDLLLSAFTEGVEAHPDDVIVLKKIMDQLVNVKRFFTKRSGDLLVEVFETFGSSAKINAEYPLGDSDADRDKAIQYDSSLKNKHYYETLEGKNEPGDYMKGVPILSKQNAQQLLDRVKRSLLGVRSLENLLATFSKLGSRFSGRNIQDKAFMNHGEMYKALNNYLACSSIGYKWNAEAGNPLNEICKVSLNTVNPPPAVKEWDDRFEECNKYFVMFIKSMIAKIFAVLGLYSIFNKPNFAQMEKMNLNLSSVRTILGGAEVPKPKIIPDALELYVRLPLLAEWYRNTIGINRTNADGTKEYNTGAPTEMMIAFVPDISGIWANFINLIFNRIDYVREGAYSEADVRILVSEINKLYMHYKKKDPKDTMYAACMGLVETINERYGLLKKEEVKAYMGAKLSGDRYTAPTNNWDLIDNPLEEVDFDILDSKDQYGRRPAPSDKYLKLRPIDITKTDKWSQEVQDAVFNFRKSLNDGFDTWMKNYSRYATPAGIGVTLSFDETIRQNKIKVAMASTEVAKYEVVRRAIYGVGKFTSIGLNKLIMFHETVASPLVSLCQLKQVLNNFENNINAIKANLAEGGAARNNVIKLLEQLYSIGSYTDLVQVNITPGRIKSVVLDFSNMRDTVENILNSVKLAISKFRLQLDRDYIQKFEAAQLPYQGQMVNNNISVYQIEDTLLEQMLKGRRWIASGAPSESTVGLVYINNTLLDIMEKINAGTNFGDEMSKLCYWDVAQMANCRNRATRTNTEFPFNILPSAELPDGSRSRALDDLEKKIAGKISIDNKFDDDNNAEQAYNQLVSMGGFYIQGIRNWYDRNPNSDHLLRLPNCEMGLLMQFNQILAKYIQQFYDAGTRKFYAPLVNDLANGFFSSAIMGGEALDDLSVGEGDLYAPSDARAPFIPADPKDGVVLYASIARAIKVLLVRQTQDGKPFYKTDTLSELQPFYVENMKTNLPGFIKLFKIIIDRACLLKLFLTDTDLANNLNRTGAVPAVSASKNGLYVGYTQIANDNMLSYLSNMLDNIRAGATAVKNCAERVYKELNDTPLFMETYPGLFEQYRATTGKYPLTLLSNLQVAMFDPGSCPGVEMNCVSHSKLLPLFRTGQYAKYNRGVRGSFNGDKYSLEYFPGFEGLVNDYNGYLQGPARFDKAFISSIVAGQISMAKYLGDIKHYKSQLVVDKKENLADVGLNYQDCLFDHNHLRDFDENKAGVPNPAHAANAYFEPYIVWSIGSNHDDFSKLLYLIENGDCGESREVVTKYLANGYNLLRDLNSSTADRKNSRFLNLMDLDIMPINIHALAREVPLINILNYSYSFDQMLIELLNPRNIESQGLQLIAPTMQNLVGAYNRPNRATPANPNRSENTLVTTLANPYMPIANYTLFYRHIGKIMAGGMGIEGFDRPKYLSDQVWNKALLHEFSPIAWNKPDASGPFVNWFSQTSDPTTGDPYVTQFPNALENPTTLTYYKEDDSLWAGKGSKTELAKVNVGNKGQLQSTTGKQRFDTRLVRNIVWLTQLQRVVRWYLKQTLQGKPYPLAYNEQTADQHNTEYFANQMYDPGEYEPFYVEK